MKLRIVIMFVGLLVVSLLVVSDLFAEIKLTPDARAEFTYEHIADGTTNNICAGEGRLRLTVSGKTENKETGFFFAAQEQSLIKVDGTYSTDDAWAQFGTKKVNLKIGRFEAESLLEKGRDTFVETNKNGGYNVPAPYRADNARGRTFGGMALGFTATDQLRFELGAVYGNTTDSDTIDGTTVKAAVNQIGFRPAVIFTVSNFTIKGGFDYLTYRPKNPDADGERNKVGFGGQVIGTFGKITVSGGAATFNMDGKNYVDGASRDEQRTTSISGRFEVVFNKDAMGIVVTHTTEDLYDSKETYAFLDYDYALPVKGYIKFAPSVAFGTDVNGKDVKAFGMRIRFDYAL
jgi:hypothetical protein